MALDARGSDARERAVAADHHVAARVVARRRPGSANVLAAVDVRAANGTLVRVEKSGRGGAGGRVEEGVAERSELLRLRRVPDVSTCESRRCAVDCDEEGARQLAGREVRGERLAGSQ